MGTRSYLQKQLPPGGWYPYLHVGVKNVLLWPWKGTSSRCVGSDTPTFQPNLGRKEDFLHRRRSFQVKGSGTGSGPLVSEDRSGSPYPWGSGRERGHEYMFPFNFGCHLIRCWLLLPASASVQPSSQTAGAPRRPDLSSVGRVSSYTDRDHPYDNKNGRDGPGTWFIRGVLPQTNPSHPPQKSQQVNVNGNPLPFFTQSVAGNLDPRGRLETSLSFLGSNQWDKDTPVWPLVSDECTQPDCPKGVRPWSYESPLSKVTLTNSDSFVGVGSYKKSRGCLVTTGVGSGSLLVSPLRPSPPPPIIISSISLSLVRRPEPVPQNTRLLSTTRGTRVPLTLGFQPERESFGSWICTYMRWDPYWDFLTRTQKFFMCFYHWSHNKYCRLRMLSGQLVFIS